MHEMAIPPISIGIINRFKSSFIGLPPSDRIGSRDTGPICR